MRGFAMKKIGEVGWVEKDAPACGPLDAFYADQSPLHPVLQMFIQYTRVRSVREPI